MAEALVVHLHKANWCLSDSGSSFFNFGETLSWLYCNATDYTSNTNLFVGSRLGQLKRFFDTNATTILSPPIRHSSYHLWVHRSTCPRHALTPQQLSSPYILVLAKHPWQLSLSSSKPHLPEAHVNEHLLLSNPSVILWLPKKKTHSIEQT